MERRLLVGGFGGQGVMVIGQLMCYTACETTDLEVTFFPSYGGEQRGGTANCFVTIADMPIGAPVAEFMDDIMVLNDPSMTKFQSQVKPGGNLFINSSIVSVEPNRTDIQIIKVPANEIADELGNPKVANLVMAGAYIGYTELLPPEKVLATAFKKLGAKSPELNPLNEAAFNRGMEIGKAAKK
ncbi:MAG TPA: 2-oxoacid:acceptor oxidoreductase family protein [Candidatus Galloscillospira excrementipullorum]|nr:2-oxoacid:acceptor oxidoreductase family protein [Candidatus Galloscillospira excrementipullorum]